jgi:hypothetical protein
VCVSLWLVVEFESNRSDPIQIEPILYKSNRFYTNRTDSKQIVPILYKSIRFYTNRTIHTHNRHHNIIMTVKKTKDAKTDKDEDNW